ncbi:SHOCT domain-containing protein [Actinocorallia longicatena]|uniref:SHOCT domain-containing protein n=1 Tax=Actinocorallia longicatena TaxID=111803 RepID=A0ABP6QIU3_9ACTN
MDDYPLLDIFWSMFIFFMWIMWFVLLFRVISDIFRSNDLGGWAKAGWITFTILLPFLGVLVYVIVRGRSMTDRDVQQLQRRDEAFRAYVRDAAGDKPANNDAAQLATLADLRERGVLTEAEFQKAKAGIIGEQPTMSQTSNGRATTGVQG